MLRRLGTVLTTGLAVVIGATIPAWAGGVTERVSVSSRGTQTNANSGDHSAPALSADGRFVAFDSEASNLVPGDTNGHVDVFVRDRRRGITERVSVGPRGAQGNEISLYPALSANGRFVAFVSLASNLVKNDTNENLDVFVRDRWRSTTERVSVGRGGFQGNGSSHDPALSADGRFVAFDSDAPNLVPGDTNGRNDVFIRDLTAGRTTRVSVGRGGVQSDNSSFSTAIAPGGRFVAFYSYASNLVAGDTNRVVDAFVHDRAAGRTERVSVGRNGAQGNRDSVPGAISAGGSFVAFGSEASNLVPGDTNRVDDVFVRDRRRDTTERVSVGRNGVQGNFDSLIFPALSADGRFVAFGSWASNLVPGDTNRAGDVFVRDRRRDTTERVSVGRNGVQGNGESVNLTGPALSADGRFVAFNSNASNLVPGDTNAVWDLFVRRR